MLLLDILSLFLGILQIVRCENSKRKFTYSNDADSGIDSRSDEICSTKRDKSARWKLPLHSSLLNELDKVYGSAVKETKTIKLNIYMILLMSPQ